MTPGEITLLVKNFIRCPAAQAEETAEVCENAPLSAEVRGLASLIDHTLLRPEARRADIEKICEEALRFGFAAVCVHPAWAAVVAARLRGSTVRTATVAGFPYGATAPAIKQKEAELGLRCGAAEIDMVLNIGALRSGESERVTGDILGVVEVCHAGGAILKVILETCYLSEQEKILACRLAQQAGADFVKTSTGLGPSGASVADVRLMRRTVGPEMGVKAAGGIRTLADALAMLGAGATRLGTSAGVKIMEEARRCRQAGCEKPPFPPGDGHPL